MRAARWLLGSAAVSSLAIALAAGCGGGTNGVAPIEEAGPDVVEDVTMHDSASEAATDAKADVTDAKSATDAKGDAACVPDATVQSLQVPDASLGDSGATASTCFACFEKDCPTLIGTCNMSCACVDAFEQFELCVGAGQQGVEACAESSLLQIPGIGITQLACALPCASECGASMTMTTGDGGKEGSTTEGGASEAGSSEAGTTSDAAGE
jgi:hypothetical protein